jgi:hypothetical protein
MIFEEKASIRSCLKVEQKPLTEMPHEPLRFVALI